MSETIQVLRCVNRLCRKQLGVFEIERIAAERRATPKYYLCQMCRRNRNHIEQIICIGCHGIMSFSGTRIKCNDCIKNMRDGYYVGKVGSKKYKGDLEIRDSILYLLRNCESVNKGMLISFVQKSWVKIRTQLNKMDGIKYDEYAMEYSL